MARHRTRGCADIARLARSILNGKDQLHAAVGRFAAGFFAALGRPRIERVFAQELASRIPLPIDAQLTAAARGLQIAGIYTCLVNGHPLADCACLHDVLTTEGKERLHQLVRGATGDWQNLPYGVGGGVAI
ncbi:hypothetical protein AAHZ94_16040 [Streptomyces sp. HSW2009]|uniref:hypothetical protein n=1 Tax=Streptomyces sp. HSW2009 TaxID=3142890 RepID=UPI0032EBD31F